MSPTMSLRGRLLIGTYGIAFGALVVLMRVSPTDPAPRQEASITESNHALRCYDTARQLLAQGKEAEALRAIDAAGAGPIVLTHSGASWEAGPVYILNDVAMRLVMSAVAAARTGRSEDAAAYLERCQRIAQHLRAAPDQTDLGRSVAQRIDNQSDRARQRMEKSAI
jgi:hypothetical protein